MRPLNGKKFFSVEVHHLLRAFQTLFSWQFILVLILQCIKNLKISNLVLFFLLLISSFLFFLSFAKVSFLEWEMYKLKLVSPSTKDPTLLASSSLKRYNDMTSYFCILVNPFPWNGAIKGSPSWLPFFKRY